MASCFTSSCALLAQNICLRSAQRPHHEVARLRCSKLSAGACWRCPPLNFQPTCAASTLHQTKFFASSSQSSKIRGSGFDRRLFDSAALLREASQILLSSGPAGALRTAQAAQAVASLSFEYATGPPLEPPALLRKLFERLGVTYIKLGQLIASSPSLFPEEYVIEFQKCLDETQPVAYREIEKVLRSELGSLEEVFEHIEATPMASASVAQVHAARLRGGAEVCLKVLKPGVEDTLKTDLDFIYLGARLLELLNPELTRASLGDIVEDIQNSMLEEVNFLAEARNIKSFSDFLERHQNVQVVAPRVYNELSTRRVLTMERFTGVPLTDLASVQRLTRSRPEETLLLVLNTWFASVLGNESFHADVHAGNLMVLDDGRVGFIDFGIVGRIRPSTWGAVQSFLLSVQTLDFEQMASSLASMGATDAEVDTRLFAQDLQQLFASLAKLDPKVEVASNGAEARAIILVDQIEINRLLIDLVRLGETHGLRFPREFGMLLKQLLYFDRYAKILAPELDMMRDQRLTALSQARQVEAS